MSEKAEIRLLSPEFPVPGIPRMSEQQYIRVGFAIVICLVVAIALYVRSDTPGNSFKLALGGAAAAAFGVFVGAAGEENALAILQFASDGTLGFGRAYVGGVGLGLGGIIGGILQLAKQANWKR